MCKFFSFITDPVDSPGWYYYFDWKHRKAHLDDDGAYDVYQKTMMGSA